MSPKSLCLSEIFFNLVILHSILALLTEENNHIHNNNPEKISGAQVKIFFTI